MFAREPGVNVPILTFVTYEDELHVFYDVQLQSMTFRNLVSVMADDAEKVRRSPVSCIN